MKNGERVNPLLCDPETGVCEVFGTSEAQIKSHVPAERKPVRIIYFTDPICSTCWGVEPQLRKLKLEYGDYFEIDYRMGGLLPSWDVYKSGGINNASDVAHHWDEVGAHYDMPLDGDVWIEDPLWSSYPPSVAFKAAQMQDEEKAVDFLRRLRELLFLEKKNITKWDYVKIAALEVGLDVVKLKSDYEDGAANQLFTEDLELARKFGVRGFPSFFYVNEQNEQTLVYGFKPYETFEQTLLKMVPKAEKKQIDTSAEFLFSKFETLATKEFSVLAGLSLADSEKVLTELSESNSLEKKTYKNGDFWIKNK